MGCFNSVMIPCPKCGELAEYQSKAGTCNLEKEQVHRADIRDVASANNETFVCWSCSCKFTFIIRSFSWNTYPVKDSISKKIS